MSYSVSVAASDSHSYLIRAGWKTSDLHVDLASWVSLFSLNLCSKLVLLPDGQCLISVDALPSAVSENIFVGQLELIDSEDAVSNKSSAVNSKRLIAVQLNFQCFHKLPGSKRQLDAKTSTALSAVQWHDLIKWVSSPTMVIVKTVEGRQCLHSLWDSPQETVQWGVVTNQNQWFVQCQSDASPVHLKCTQQCWPRSKPAVHLSICEQWSWNHSSVQDLSGSPQCGGKTHSLSSLPSGDYVTHEGNPSEDLNIFRSAFSVAVELRLGVRVVRQSTAGKQYLSSLQWSPVLASATVQCGESKAVARGLRSGDSIPQSVQSISHTSWYQCSWWPFSAHSSAFQFLAVWLHGSDTLSDEEEVIEFCSFKSRKYWCQTFHSGNSLISQLINPQWVVHQLVIFLQCFVNDSRVLLSSPCWTRVGSRSSCSHSGHRALQWPVSRDSWLEVQKKTVGEFNAVPSASVWSSFSQVKKKTKFCTVTCFNSVAPKTSEHATVQTERNISDLVTSERLKESSEFCRQWIKPTLQWNICISVQCM